MIFVRGKKFRCQIEFAVFMIRGKWKVDIIWYLKENGVLRFSEIKRLIPRITKHILSQQLSELEYYKLIERKVYPEAPPRVEYSLTKSGGEMAEILLNLLHWADGHINEIKNEEGI